VSGSLITVGHKPVPVLAATTDEIQNSIALVTFGAVVVMAVTGNWEILLVPILLIILVIAASQEQ